MTRSKVCSLVCVGTSTNCLKLNFEPHVEFHGTEVTSVPWLCNDVHFINQNLPLHIKLNSDRKGGHLENGGHLEFLSGIHFFPQECSLKKVCTNLDDSIILS